MRNKLTLFLVTLSIFSISFCNAVKAEDNPQSPNQAQQVLLVNTITLEENTKTIEIGKVVTISAIISPENVTDKTLIWSTSDDKIVTVDNNGSITALMQGTAIISVKTPDATKEATCTITVIGHKGWILENKKWYYYDYETSIKKTGWLFYNNFWYYLGMDGDMKTDWQEDKGSWYYLNPSGEMLVGWKQYNDSWYYLDSTGRMKTGLLIDNGTSYYLYSNGKMATTPAGLWSSTGYFLIIDSKNQVVNLFSGSANHWSFIRSMICSSGKASTPTIKGLFTIQDRGEVFRAASNTICKYYTAFYGNYLFHSVLLDNNGNIQDPTLGVPVSHGCVRLSIEDAKFINYNIPYGTRVWSN